jgi:hypothetical protein
MRPWEEEWVYDGRRLGVVEPGHEHPEVWAYADYGNDPEPRARLASAAPEMARLLLEMHSWAVPACPGACKGDKAHAADCRFVAVLAKAGVLP